MGALCDSRHTTLPVTANVALATSRGRLAQEPTIYVGMKMRRFMAPLYKTSGYRVVA